ncbi:MAG: hypothetical protein ACMXYK_02365 [Candidatus Woesearchaeota archaeon]
MNRKAMELTINFLVTFIVGIVVFGLGVVMLWSIFNSSVDLMNLSHGSIEMRFPALNCNTREDICVGQSVIELTPGDIFLLEVKLFNNFDTQMDVNYTVELLNADNSRAAQTGSPTVGRFQITPEQERFSINGKSEGEISTAVYLERNMPKGVYVIRYTINRVVSGETLRRTQRITMYVV